MDVYTINENLTNQNVTEVFVILFYSFGFETIWSWQDRGVNSCETTTVQGVGEKSRKPYLTTMGSLGRLCFLMADFFPSCSMLPLVEPMFNVALARWVRQRSTFFGHSTLFRCLAGCCALNLQLRRGDFSFFRRYIRCGPNKPPPITFVLIIIFKNEHSKSTQTLFP